MSYPARPRGKTGPPRLPPHADPKRNRRREIARESMMRTRDERRAKFRPIIDKWFDKPCVDCGVKYPRACMQADHVHGEKKYKISFFYYGNGTMKGLLAELKKCEVRCANCHCLRHAVKRNGNLSHG